MAISEELKQRIENFGMGRRSPRGSMQMGVSGKGATDSIQMGSMMEMARETKGAISNKDLEILNQASSLTPEERAQLMQEIENARMREMAPLGQVSSQIEQMGTGDDQFLVHTEFGDTIVPPQIINDDPELEAMLERKFEEYNITPEERVVGSGIATLNPQTGLPEYGFFKKLIKGIGKVVKKVAPVAAFIPGVGTALGGVLGGIGGKVVSGISKLAPGLGSTLGSIGSSVMSGIANLGVPGFSSIAGGTAGGFGGIKGALTTRSGLFGGGPLERIMGADPSSTAVRSLEAAREAALASGDAAQVAAIDAQLATYKAGTDLYNRPQIIGTDPATGAPIYAQPQQGGIGGLFGGQGGGFGGQGGGMGALGMAGLAGLAGTLGKMAYDETKKDMGVPMTPMTMLGPVGRFNIEAEIARRMGQEAPNPVEFGLLPQGTFPELSGGRPLESEMMPSMGVSQPPVMGPIDMVDPRTIPNRPPSIEQISPLDAVDAPPLKKDLPRIMDIQPPKEGFPIQIPLPPRPPSIEYIPKIVDAPPVVQQPPMMPIDMPIDMPINIPQIAQLDIPMVMPELPATMPAVQPMPMPRRAVDSIRPRISRRRGRGVGALRRANGGEIMNYEGGGSANKYPNEGLEALARVAPDVVRRMGYAGGGPIYPMAYAEGGNVSMEDFERMNGGINGAGTETSDDIPAMLSDGEFVMTGQAVRGAGSYEMAQDNRGIISLIPNMQEDRERGTRLMYDLMDAFDGKAGDLQ
jgi:hypothetical protein